MSKIHRSEVTGLRPYDKLVAELEPCHVLLIHLISYYFPIRSLDTKNQW